MTPKSVIAKFLYIARDLRSKALFEELRRHVTGDVLDVGGWDFFLTVIKKKDVDFTSWTTLEYSTEHLPDINHERFTAIRGDGCDMPFRNNQFDTVLNIQVLEHVFDPLGMVHEMARVLKPGGHAIVLIPQTGTLHAAPHHYYNFTRYWIQEAMERAGLQILKLKPLGGAWSTIASRLVYFFLQSARLGGMSPRECERNALFYLLYPLMALYAIASIPVCMLFSLGDLTEEPNNHLVVVRKR